MKDKKEQPMTTGEAADLLGLDKRTLDNMRSDSRGPAYLKLSGRAIRYLYADVIAYRDGKRIEPVNN